MSSAQTDLAICAEALNVQRLADAMNAARMLSKKHPGVIAIEVDLADQHVRKAIHELLEAQGYFARALGRMVLDERKANAS